MGQPVEFRTVSPFTWVHVSRLSYGIPDEAVTSALAPFSGGIKTISQAVHKGIYTGERNILMKITSNIPGRLRISGHWCAVRYSGQKQVCFRCHKEGHVIGQCPSANSTSTAPTLQSTTTHSTIVSASTATISPSTPQATYAAVASGACTTSRIQAASIERQPTTDEPSTAPAPAADLASTSDAENASHTMDVTTPATTSTAIHSPVRRRAKRRRSPLTSPQPHEKKATPAAASSNAADFPDHSPPHRDASLHTRDSSVEPLPLTEESEDDSADHDYETDFTQATDDPGNDGNVTTDTITDNPKNGNGLVNSGYDTLTDTPDDALEMEKDKEDLATPTNTARASHSQDERREVYQPLRKEGLQALNEACKEAFLPQPTNAARQALDLYAAAALPLPEADTDF